MLVAYVKMVWWFVVMENLETGTLRCLRDPDLLNINLGLHVNKEHKSYRYIHTIHNQFFYIMPFEDNKIIIHSNYYILLYGR